MRKAVARLALPLGGIAGILLVWQIGFMLADLNPKIFPPPSTIFLTLLRLMTPTPGGGPPPILGHLASSLKNISLAMVIAIIVGPSIGMAMGTSRIVHGALSPIVNALLPIPPYAYIPIILLWFGHGSTTIVTATALAAMLPLIYTTSAGTRAIDKRQVFVLRSLGANRFQVLARVVVPAALAAIVSGLRQSFGQGWRTLIGGEFIAAAGSGIGYLMFNARDFLAVDVMFACVLILSLFGMLCIYGLVGSIENLTLRKWGLLTEGDARR
jgi:ABC-type nitrate/sulfonate/bicarbonate transport system permease component